MLDSIQHKTFSFFLNEHHPEKGIVKDRTTSSSPCSMRQQVLHPSAIGAERNWMSRPTGCRDNSQNPEILYQFRARYGKDVTGYKGFYYHFLKMDSGTRGMEL